MCGMKQIPHRGPTEAPQGLSIFVENFFLPGFVHPGLTDSFRSQNPTIGPYRESHESHVKCDM